MITTPGSATAKALEAFKSGSDVGAAVYGEPSQDFGDTGPENDLAEEVVESLSPDSPESDDSAPEAASTIEEIAIGGKKLKLDLSDPKNKEAIIRELKRANGASKLQKEREQLLSKQRELEAKHNELSNIWNTLESTFKQHGHKGVVNLLAGEGAWDKQLQAEMARARAYEAADPSQKRQMELEEQLEAERQEKNRMMADIKAETERAKADRAVADQRAAEAAVHPVFDKYRFAGKLGDVAAEQQLDEAIWTRAIGNIQALPEHELTQARIDKEFRTVAATFQRFIKDQSDKKAESVIKKKKEDAMTNVSAAAKAGMKGEATKASVTDRIKAGDFKSSLMDVLTGRVKL